MPCPPAGTCCRLPTKDWSKTKDISSLIVTMCEIGSYDNIYRNKMPESPEEGMAVSLFQFNYSAIESLVRCVESSGQQIEGPCPDVIRDLWADMCRVDDPRAIVLNWECCTPNLAGHFGNSHVCKLTRLFIDRGHLAIFGDYATQALIKEWDTSVLGPNPFANVGTGAGSSVLRFDREILEQCPSSQLVTLANLCDRGSAGIQGTCQFVTKKEPPKTDEYTLELLTVMTGPSHNSQAQCVLEIKGEETAKGTAGHVLLRYAKGNLLLAGPHWVELCKCEVNLDRMLQFVAQNEAPEKARDLREQWTGAGGAQQMEMMQSYACEKVCKACPAISQKKSAL
eukprot:m51a1_g2980 hypothetical protein (339) ;mRNA; f:718805-719821